MFHTLQCRRRNSSVSTPTSLLYNQRGKSYQLGDIPLCGCGYHLNDTLHLCHRSRLHNTNLTDESGLRSQPFKVKHRLYFTFTMIHESHPHFGLNSEDGRAAAAGWSGMWDYKYMTDGLNLRWEKVWFFLFCCSFLLWRSWKLGSVSRGAAVINSNPTECYKSLPVSLYLSHSFNHITHVCGNCRKEKDSSSHSSTGWVTASIRYTMKCLIHAGSASVCQQPHCLYWFSESLELKSEFCSYKDPKQEQCHVAEIK